MAEALQHNQQEGIMNLHIEEIFKSLDIDPNLVKEGDLEVYSPIDGQLIAKVSQNKEDEVDHIVQKSQKAFQEWRQVPAPLRGEFVRLLGEELRVHKDTLGKLVTLECGKILSEGLGEVQEMIDICDFAVGLSRQLYGLTISSERPGHHMREVWHPLGPVGVITAFNFPVAVWAWNSALALVCGDSVIWKPSEKTPLTAIACNAIFKKAVIKFKEQGHSVPDDLLQLLIAGAEVSQQLVDHKKVPLISATGSTRMGRIVSERVGARLGKCLLELGGNNGMIVAESADLEMAVRAILFGAVGTAGQRCTSLRRLIVHESIYDKLIPSLVSAYKSLRVGNPLEPDTLVGPLIDEDSFNAMQKAIANASDQGGNVLVGGQRCEIDSSNGFYVYPALIEMEDQSEIVREETFAPILYVIKYNDLEQAMKMHNNVPQGLSSCIFTNDVREAELFLSNFGSDCGIANVNIGPSGAEIGGAFGGEKDTGGGRESGSDSWRAYMRRQTQTVNYSTELPLAQGVEFDL
jgi:aldehyde dehydrogenase (NAD+)